MISAALVALVLGQCPPFAQARVDAGVCAHVKEGSRLVFHLDAQGNPENLGTDVTALQRAVATWQDALACGSVSMAVGARTKSRLILEDDENVVLFRFKRCSAVVPAADPCWADGSCGNQYDCWDHAEAPLALAVTIVPFDAATGVLREADIELNWASFYFTTADAPPCALPNVSQSCVATDLQGALTHELGHALGLGHACSRASTMYFEAANGQTSQRVLDPGSRLFACEAYPAGQPAPGCARGDDGLGPLPTRRGCGCGAGAGVPWVGLVPLGRLARRRSLFRWNR